MHTNSKFKIIGLSIISTIILFSCQKKQAKAKARKENEIAKQEYLPEKNEVDAIVLKQETVDLSRCLDLCLVFNPLAKASKVRRNRY